MKFFSRSSLKALCFALLALTVFPLAASAGIDGVRGALGEGSIDASAVNTGNGASGVTGQGKNDADPGERFEKLMALIRAEEPGIESLPAPAGESSTTAVGLAREKRMEIYAAMMKNAAADLEAGRYEKAFTAFKNIYSEYNMNSRALYFMAACRAKQGDLKDAAGIAEELLDIVRKRNASEKLMAAIDAELAAISGISGMAPNPELAKESGAKFDACLKKIKAAFPAIEKIPEKANRPKDTKNPMNDALNAVDHEIAQARVERLRAAAKLFDGGEYENAYAAFEKIHGEFPHNLRALYYMALCQRKLGRPDAAATILSKVTGIVRNRHDVRRDAKDLADELGTGGRKSHDDSSGGVNGASKNGGEAAPGAISEGPKNGNAAESEGVNAADIGRDDRVIKVVSYNIAKGQGKANNSAIYVGHRFLDEIVRLLKSEDADLIGMQEVDNNRRTTGGVDEAEYIAKRLRMHHFWHEASARGPRENINEHGNAVLSKNRILQKEYVEFKAHGPAGAKPMFSETRGLTWALVDFGGAKVNFISTHFGFPENARVGQARELVAFIKKLEGPVVLTGDFNTHYSDKSRSYRIINEVLDNAYDRAMVKGGKNGIAPHRGFIDFIFVTPGVFECESVSLGGAEYAGASDHRPNITVLKFKKGEKK